MASPIAMLHETDPVKDLLAKTVRLSDWKVMSAKVLVAVYQRPAKTKSGLYLSDQTRVEDKYQGKVGLVIAKGPLAFTEDDRHHWDGVVPGIGDWVFYNPGDTQPFEAGDDQRCRFVEDADIYAILPQPDLVW